MFYVSKNIRPGLLGRMLQEILSTRVMIKRAMPDYKAYTEIYRQLEHKQLSLKFIANVMYGYVGASYSGRMPCVEIADSIVICAREVLQSVSFNLVIV